MTEQQIIQVFIDAAEAHPDVKWSDVGTSGFLFRDGANLIYPAFFVQPQGAVLDNEQLTNTFTLYCLDLPLPEEEFSSQAFGWNTHPVQSRDTTLQIIRDIIGKIRVENGIQLTYTYGPLVQDGDSIGGWSGWRIDVEVGRFFGTTNATFPYVQTHVVTSSTKFIVPTAETQVGEWAILTNQAPFPGIAPQEGDDWTTISGTIIAESNVPGNRLNDSVAVGDLVRFTWGDGNASFPVVSKSSRSVVLGNAQDIVGTIGRTFTNDELFTLEADVIKE